MRTWKTALSAEMVVKVECAANETDVAALRYERFVYWSRDITYASNAKLPYSRMRYLSDMRPLSASICRTPRLLAGVTAASSAPVVEGGDVDAWSAFSSSRFSCDGARVDGVDDIVAVQRGRERELCECETPRAGGGGRSRRERRAGSGDSGGEAMRFSHQIDGCTRRDMIGLGPSARHQA